MKYAKQTQSTLKDDHDPNLLNFKEVKSSKKQNIYILENDTIISNKCSTNNCVNIDLDEIQTEYSETKKSSNRESSSNNKLDKQASKKSCFYYLSKDNKTNNLYCRKTSEI